MLQTQTQTETYTLTEPEFLDDPYPVYRRMRQRDPVYWSDTLGAWVLTRYDDVLAAVRNPAMSSATAVTPPSPPTSPALLRT
jgi:cytochrome P450